MAEEEKPKVGGVEREKKRHHGLDTSFPRGHARRIFIASSEHGISGVTGCQALFTFR